MIGDQRATPILLRTLNDRSDDWLGRGMSANALGMIGDRSATGYLINAAWAADTRGDAIQALARIGDPKSAEVLISALGKDEEADTAEAAKQGLISIGKDAAALLAKTLEERPPEDKDDLYYRRIRETLEQINNREK